jgi:hypothetical protein
MSLKIRITSFLPVWLSTCHVCRKVDRRVLRKHSSVGHIIEYILDRSIQGPRLWFFNIWRSNCRFCACFLQIRIVTLVFKKNAKCFGENWRKSQKIVIITSTPAWADRNLHDGKLLGTFVNPKNCHFIWAKETSLI